MSTLLHLIVLGVLLFVMGYLTAQPGRRNWRKMAGFIGATALAVGMTVLGMILVIVILGLYIGSIALLNLELGLFLGIISVAVAAGILIFLIVWPIVTRTGISVELLTITEYYIQWMLIYVTVYQVVFDQLKGFGKAIGEIEVSQELNSYLSTVLNPTALIAILLPVLLAVWVAVAIAKFRLEALERDDAAPPGPPVLGAHRSRFRPHAPRRSTVPRRLTARMWLSVQRRLPVRRRLTIRRRLPARRRREFRGRQAFRRRRNAPPRRIVPMGTTRPTRRVIQSTDPGRRRRGVRGVER